MRRTVMLMVVSVVLFVSKAPAQSQVQSFEDRLAELIPEFAGVYRHSDGSLVIRVTDLSMTRSGGEGAVREFVLRELAANGRSDIKVVRFEAAQYSYSQLRSWMRRGLDSLGAHGAVSWGVDQRTSEIRVGVPNEAALAAIRKAFNSLGIPSDAVVVAIESGRRWPR